MIETCTHLKAHLQLFLMEEKYFMAAKELTSFQPDKNFKFFLQRLNKK